MQVCCNGEVLQVSSGVCALSGVLRGCMEATQGNSSGPANAPLQLQLGPAAFETWMNGLDQLPDLDAGQLVDALQVCAVIVRAALTCYTCVPRYTAPWLRIARPASRCTRHE